MRRHSGVRSLELRGIVALALLLLLGACAQALAPPGPGPTTPRLAEEALITRDGLALPLRAWLPEADPPRAVVLALHGFNDYSKAFEMPGRYLSRAGVALYAYDQRGFGAAPHTGLWAGSEALVADLKTAAALIGERHPEAPLFLLGESMGGAVVVAAATTAHPPPARGLILSAPAVWSRGTMPFYQRWALWLGSRLLPGMRLTGEGLGIRASDNDEMLRELGRDPLFIKGTRVDAVAGLSALMDQALAAAPRLRQPALLLYGAKDQVIPAEPTLAFWQELPSGAHREQRRALYAEGWHLLLRDLQAEVVYEDILSWIADPRAALPSGADGDATVRLAESL